MTMANARQFLATRTAAWAKSGYTAKDYVQDGLIGMWDGIENAGWGVHDPNATAWKDLAGSTDLEVYGRFEKDRVVSVGKNENGVVRYFGRWNTSIFDIAFKYDSIIQGDNGCVKLGRWTSIYYDPTGWLNCSSYPNKLNSQIVNGTSHHICLSSGFWLDGALLSQTEEPRAPYSAENDAQRFLYSVNGAIFGIRRYSRSLTEDEIAHNYAIDKARFGLT